MELSLNKVLCYSFFVLLPEIPARAIFDYRSTPEQKNYGELTLALVDKHY